MRCVLYYNKWVGQKRKSRLSVRFHNNPTPTCMHYVCDTTSTRHYLILFTARMCSGSCSCSFNRTNSLDYQLHYVSTGARVGVCQTCDDDQTRPALGSGIRRTCGRRIRVQHACLFLIHGLRNARDNKHFVTTIIMDFVKTPASEITRRGENKSSHMYMLRIETK